MEYNIYCDESCHLENDSSSKMTLGCIWTPSAEVANLHSRIREIKSGHAFPWEVKWNKVSPGKLQLYLDLVSFFWSEPSLNYRGIVVSDKSKLDHTTFNAGSHDSFYYKMFYQALLTVLSREHSYRIYLDIKDTRSSERLNILRTILRRKLTDDDGSIVRSIQSVRSHEVGLVQICDVITGAVTYFNRGLHSSTAKSRVVDAVASGRQLPLHWSSPKDATKFNLFIFDPQNSHDDNP